MPLARELNLKRYNISDSRYRELKYFCLQYREKKSQLLAITELNSPKLDNPGGGCGGTSDNTASTALRRVQLQKDIELIEQSALEASADFYQYILSNVADDVAYEHLGIPMSRRAFFRLKANFFKVLSQRKNKVGTNVP